MCRGLIIGAVIFGVVFFCLNISKKEREKKDSCIIWCAVFLFSAANTGLAVWLLPKIKFCDLGDVMGLKIIAGIEIVGFIVNLVGFYKNNIKSKSAI